MAKYKSFDEYVKGEKIVRYTEWFKKCWDFAIEAAVENGSSHNKQSTPCTCTNSCVATIYVCKDCGGRVNPKR